MASQHVRVPLDQIEIGSLVDTGTIQGYVTDIFGDDLLVLRGYQSGTQREARVTSVYLRCCCTNVGPNPPEEYHCGIHANTTKTHVAQCAICTQQGLAHPGNLLCIHCGTRFVQHVWGVHPHRMGRSCPGFEIVLDESFED